MIAGSQYRLEPSRIFRDTSIYITNPTDIWWRSLKLTTVALPNLRCHHRQQQHYRRLLGFHYSMTRLRILNTTDVISFKYFEDMIWNMPTTLDMKIPDNNKSQEYEETVSHRMTLHFTGNHDQRGWSTSFNKAGGSTRPNYWPKTNTQTILKRQHSLFFV